MNPKYFAAFSAAIILIGIGSFAQPIFAAETPASTGVDASPPAPIAPVTTSRPAKNSTPAELTATLDDIVALMAKGDMIDFYNKYTPPEERTGMPPGEESDIQARMQQQTDSPTPQQKQRMEDLLQNFQSFKKQTPVFNTTGDEATFQMTMTPAMFPRGVAPTQTMPTVPMIFEKVAGQWFPTSRSVPPPIPVDALQALHSAKQAVLFSMEPQARPGTNDKSFHDFKVLGQVDLNEKQTATAASAFEAAVNDWKRGNGMCFNPRHGLRVTNNGHTFDFVLCYECGHLYIYKDDARLADLPAAGSPKILNDLLTAHNVPLSQSGLDEAARQKAEDTAKAK